MKKRAALSLLVSGSLLHGQHQPSQLSGAALTQERYPLAFLPPATVRPLKAIGIATYADFLYWYTYTDGLAIAHTSKELTFPNFKFKPGFRLGISGQSKNLETEVLGEYTWFHHKFHSNNLISSFGLSWISNFDHTTSGRGPLSHSWDIRLDQADFLFVRPHYSSANTIFSPSFGIRALRFEQSLKSTFTDSQQDPVEISCSTSSVSLGPKTDVKCEYFLTDHLKALSSASLSLLFTKFSKVRATKEEFIPHRSLKTSTPCFSMSLGLSYGSYLFKDHLFIDLSAQYEATLYLSLNYLGDINNQSYGSSGTASDLGLQGFTTRLKIYF